MYPQSTPSIARTTNSSPVLPCSYSFSSRSISPSKHDNGNQRRFSSPSPPPPVPTLKDMAPLHLTHPPSPPISPQSSLSQHFAPSSTASEDKILDTSEQRPSAQPGDSSLSDNGVGFYTARALHIPLISKEKKLPNRRPLSQYSGTSPPLVQDVCRKVEEWAAAYPSPLSTPRNSSGEKSLFSPRVSSEFMPWEREWLGIGSLSSETTPDRSSLVPWETQGLAEAASSTVVAQLPPYHPVLATEKQTSGTRDSWYNVLDEVAEAGRRVLRDDENNSTYPRYNTAFSPSIIPPKGKVSEPAKFSTPKPGREQVLQVQVSFDSCLECKVADVFFDRILRRSEEYNRRAICVDDPDVPPSSFPAGNEKKEGELPLHEALKRNLPSPSVFTLTSYRSKYHSIRDVEKASAGPDAQYTDRPFQSRVERYIQNKEIIRSAMSKGGIESITVPSSLSARDGKSSKPPRYICREQGDENGMYLEEAIQFGVLRNWELTRDIERLEVLKRSVMNARASLIKHPSLTCFSIARARDRRQEPRLDAESIENHESPTDVQAETCAERGPTDMLTNPLTLGIQLRHVESYEDLVAAYVLHAAGASAPAQTPPMGRPFRFHDSDYEVTASKKRLSSVYSGDTPSPGSHGSTSRAGSAQQKIAKAEKEQLLIQMRHRAAAYETVRKLEMKRGAS